TSLCALCTFPLRSKAENLIEHRFKEAIPMRLTSLLIVLFALLPAQTQSDPCIPNANLVHMWSRAQSSVIPLDLYASDRAELESLRGRVTQAEADAAALAPIRRRASNLSASCSS